MMTFGNLTKVGATAAACVLSLVAAPIAAAADPTAALTNPAIDSARFERVALEAMRHRAQRRISEAEFIRFSGEPGTVVLDARSAEKYVLLHVRGAINLSFPDITEESLARLLPNRAVRILIYCNNNFRDDEAAFPRKLPSAALNLSTYTSLYDYGYRNVYELGPLIDVTTTAIPMQRAGAALAGR